MLLLLACVPDPKPPFPPDDAEDSGETTGEETGEESAVETGGESGEETGETAEETAADTAPPYVWDPPPVDTGPFPTAEAPFVVESCGFDDGHRSVALLGDRDGDDVEELFILGYMTPEEEAGAWVVSSSVTSGAYWDQALGWRFTTDWGWARLPDVDGDGLEELFALESVFDGGVQLLPDGTLGETWSGLPYMAIPWHDVDGDGADEVLGGWRDGVRVVSPAEVTTTDWPALAGVEQDVDEDAPYAWALFSATMDADGDGWPEVIATGGSDEAYLLSSEAIDAGATWSGATLQTFDGVGWRVAAALGDVDGSGDEDFAFPAYRSVTLFRGEWPASERTFDDGDLGDADHLAVAPDGAGGLALWQVHDGDVRLLDLADLLAGTVTELRSGSLGVDASFVTTRGDVVWVLADDGVAWLPETAALRLDPATLTVIATIDGGGFGGQAEGYELDDVDWDGKLDWWQADGLIWSTPIAPGTTVSLCDARVDDPLGHYVSGLVDDLDGDGSPEWLLYEEGPVTLWNADAGVVAELAAWENSAGLIGCDLTGDGPAEIYLSSTFNKWLVDPLELVRGTTSWQTPAEFEPTCIGDLNGDGVSELSDQAGWLRVSDGASVISGTLDPLTVIDTTLAGYVIALGDADGDRLPDVGFSNADGVCVLTGAEILADADLEPHDLAHCTDRRTWFSAADIDGDGLTEVLLPDGAGGLLAWSIDTDTTEQAWTPAEGEDLLDVVPDAFGQGRAAIVLGPDPIVIYAL